MRIPSAQSFKEELCGMDLMSGWPYVGCAIFLNERLDETRFLAALTKTIERNPYLAATLVTEEGKFFLTNGEGLDVSVVEFRETAPTFIPGEPSDIDFLSLAAPAPSTPFGNPLLLLKLTQFQNKSVIGLQTNHALCDAYTTAAWFSDLANEYDGKSVNSNPHFSRLEITRLASNEPLGELAGIYPDRPSTWFDVEQRVLKIDAETCATFRRMSKGAGVGWGNFLKAVLIRAFASSRGEQEVSLISAYNGKFLKPSISKDYRGNSVLTTTQTFKLTTALSPFSLTDQFAKPTINDFARGVGWAERCYQEGRADPEHGWMIETTPYMDQSTLAINLIDPSAIISFNGRVEAARNLLMSKPLNYNMIVAFWRKQTRDVCLIVTLSQSQIDRFEEALKRQIEELT